MTAIAPTFQEYDWGARYGPHWGAIAKQAEQLQTVNGKVICAWCGESFDHQETQVHHARYSLDGQTLLKDEAMPLRDVFAVCGTADSPGTCHHALHQESLWIKDDANRVAGDRNTDTVLDQLQAKFLTEDTMTTTQEPADNTDRRRWRDRFQQTADRGREAYEESWIMRLVSWVLVSSLIAALAYVSWLNIAPYVALVKALGLGTPNWLADLPLLRLLVKTSSELIVTIVGVLVWMLVQVLQCLWLLISLDKAALHGAVHNAQAGRFQLSGNADARARSVVRKASRIPYFFIRWGALLSLGAYAFDLIIGLSLYPPAADLGTFLFAISSGLWSEIDGKNFCKLLVMLFAFEGVLILLIVALQWLRTRQAGRTVSA